MDRKALDDALMKRLLPRDRSPKRDLTSPSTASGGSTSGRRDDALINPMDDYGQMIRGGESGSPMKVDQATVADQVLTAVLTSGELLPAWVDPSEKIRDVIGAALAAGTGITVTVSDVGDTITIAATATGLNYLYWTSGSSDTDPEWLVYSGALLRY